MSDAYQIGGFPGTREPKRHYLISEQSRAHYLMAKRPLVALFVLAAIPCIALAQSAQDFANKVAISDMFEIQSSQLALTKQPDADTKPFAEKMISGHQKTSSELKALVSNGKVKATLPSALDSEHQRMLDELKLKNGNDFDRSYDAIQLKAHQEAVSLFDAYSKNGDNRDLKSWAATTLPHLKEHLSMAEKLK